MDESQIYDNCYNREVCILCEGETAVKQGFCKEMWLNLKDESALTS